MATTCISYNDPFLNGWLDTIIGNSSIFDVANESVKKNYCQFNRVGYEGLPCLESDHPIREVSRVAWDCSKRTGQHDLSHDALYVVYPGTACYALAEQVENLPLAMVLELAIVYAPICSSMPENWLLYRSA
jgi:hypothetical protein